MSGLGFGTRVGGSIDQTVAVPSGDGRTVQIIGLKEVLRMFNDLDRELRKTANGQLRQAARKIADDLQQKVQSSGGGPSHQGAAVAATARARNDRIVKVAVPGVNIRFPSESVGGSRRGSIAFGANYGPAGSINYYGVSRNGGGYFVEPAVDGVMNLADERYMTALDAILRQYGLIG